MSAPARQLFLAVAILAVLGIAVSSVSLDHHFRKSKTTYCDFGQSFNCDLVNRSEYSTIQGIPIIQLTGTREAMGYLPRILWGSISLTPKRRNWTTLSRRIET